MDSESPSAGTKAGQGVAADVGAADYPCTHVSAREASYLLALGRLQEQAREPTQAALARAMSVSAPTALEMVRRLRADGLIDPERLFLTQSGVSSVLHLASRRHAALLLTQQVLGLDDDSAQAEADRLAPNLSATLARRLLVRERR